MRLRISNASFLLVPLLWSWGCGAPTGARSGESSPSGTEADRAPAAYALETDSEIPEGEPIILTAGSKVYQCAKATDAAGNGKVQCSVGAESGLSLHRQK